MEKVKKNSGFAKIGLKALKEVGVYLPLLVAAYGNKKGFCSPSALTKKMKGGIAKSDLRVTSRGLKVLTKKGLIVKENCFNYHSVACAKSEDFAIIPNDYCMLDANTLRLYACLSYAFKTKRMINTNKIRVLCGLRADLAPLIKKIRKLNDGLQLLAHLEEYKEQIKIRIVK